MAIYSKVTTSKEAKFLIVSMATFSDNKQALWHFSVCSYNYQTTAKQL